MKEEYYEESVFENCPACGRSYNDIDFDFQCCSKCGWDADKKRYDPEIYRHPKDADYLSGDADILTGEWY